MPASLASAGSLLFASGAGESRFATETQACLVALLQQRQAEIQQFLCTLNNARQRLALYVSLCRLLQMLVPDVIKGMVKTNAFEAVIETNGPTFFASSLWQKLLGKLLEPSDLRSALHHFAS